MLVVLYCFLLFKKAKHNNALSQEAIADIKATLLKDLINEVLTRNSIFSRISAGEDSIDRGIRCLD